jgi:1-acyl-sn-glycerol-3-phosphate acyltransferase
MKRETLKKIIHFLLDHLTTVEYRGAENIPPSGGVIIATNHNSRIDIPLLFANPVRPDITALVADKYQNSAFFRWFTLTAGGIWIDRSKADFAAFRLAAEIIHEGRSLGIAPEGTRSDGALIEGKSGTVLLAIRTGVPVVPVGIAGSETAFTELRHFRKPKLIVSFGSPLTFAPIPRDEDRDAVLQRYTDELMCQIAALLPSHYHGFYKDHPRLQEILKQMKD